LPVKVSLALLAADNWPTIAGRAGVLHGPCWLFVFDKQKQAQHVFSSRNSYWLQIASEFERGSHKNYL
jgi:hypothetical protein